MKKFVLEFLRRGTMACGLGPIVLAVIYIILDFCSVTDTLTASQASVGILSLSALAFIAGGMNAIYQIERIPLMIAISIHGIVLYVMYLLTYILNDWLDVGIISLMVFTAIFIVGYIVIWCIVYSIARRKTTEINEILEQKQKTY